MNAAFARARGLPCGTWPEQVGVAVEGSGVRVRLELREGVEELVEVLVHAPACFDCEDRGLLVLSAAKRFVVFPSLLGCGVFFLLSKVIFKGKGGPD